MVSTLAEACFYADHGFDDILYAYSLPFDKVLATHTPKRLNLYEYVCDCVRVCSFTGGALCSAVREARSLPDFIGSSSGSGAAQAEATERRPAVARLDETGLWQRER